MTIHPPQIIQDNDSIKINFKINFENYSKILWYSIQQEHEDLLSNSCDAALLALLIPAMAEGENIHVEGEISGKLWHNLMRSYQHIAYQVMPWLKKINITATTLSSAVSQGEGVLAGFSGGVDSYSLLHDYHYSDIPEHLKLTHLLFNNVGSHGRKNPQALFETRFQRLLPIAREIGLPLIQANSNVADFYTGKLTFTRTDNIRNASVALLLQGGINTFMAASSYTYDTLYVGESNLMATCDAIALPLLSSESIECFAVGNEYTRVEKVMQISKLPICYDSLDVCTNGKHYGTPTNCSSCRKCNFTLLTLEISGHINLFAKSFDLATYRKGKRKFLRKLLPERRILAQEIRKFGTEKGYNFPILTLLTARIKHGVLNLFNSEKTSPRRYDGGTQV